MVKESADPVEEPMVRTGAAARYTQLRDEIASGALPPGSPVHEVALSNRLGVSRAPIRDAILRLEADGLVERGPRGTIVRVRTADEIFDIYQARIALEGEAAATAAQRSSPLDVTRLELLHAEAEKEEHHDQPRARELHARWHGALASAARNQTIIELLQRLTLQLAPYETVSLAETPNLDRTHDEHADLLGAIRSGDAASARRLMTAHLERTRDVRVAALLRSEG